MANNALYVGFSRTAGGGFFSRLLGRAIRFFERAGSGAPNHAFLLYRDDHLGWMTIGANQNGVTYLPLDAFLRSRSVVKLFTTATPGTLWAGLDALKDDIGKAYNLSGLVGMAPVEIAVHWLHFKHLSNWLSNPHTLFCSEFVAEVIRRAGYQVLGHEAADVIDPAALCAALNGDPNWIGYTLKQLGVPTGSPLSAGRKSSARRGELAGEIWDKAAAGPQME